MTEKIEKAVKPVAAEKTEKAPLVEKAIKAEKAAKAVISDKVAVVVEKVKAEKTVMAEKTEKTAKLIQKRLSKSVRAHTRRLKQEARKSGIVFHG
jgi:hypothetical protein